MGYIGLFISFIGLIFCAFWVKNAKADGKDKFYAIFSLLGMILLFIVSVCLLFTSR